MDRLASRMIQLSEDSTKTYQEATAACDKIKTDTTEYLSQYFLEHSVIPSVDDISAFIRTKCHGGFDPATKQPTDRINFVDTPTHFQFHISIEVDKQIALATFRIEKEKKSDDKNKAATPAVAEEVNPVSGLRGRR